MLSELESVRTMARIKHLRMESGHSVVVSMEEMSVLEKMESAKYMRSIFNPKRCGYRDMFVAWLDPNNNLPTPPPEKS